MISDSLGLSLLAESQRDILTSLSSASTFHSPLLLSLLPSPSSLPKCLFIPLSYLFILRRSLSFLCLSFDHVFSLPPSTILCVSSLPLSLAEFITPPVSTILRSKIHSVFDWIITAVIKPCLALCVLRTYSVWQKVYVCFCSWWYLYIVLYTYGFVYS